MNKRIEKEILLILFPLSSLILTAILYKIMPDSIPMCFTLAGKVVSYADKSAFVFLIPILSIFFYLYFLCVPIIDKQRDSYMRFNKAYTIMRIAGGAALALINAVYILSIFFPNRVELMILFKVGIAVGLLFFGDRLPQIKRNHFVGVINPWTLRSDYVWQKTQRFTGKLMFAIATILFIISFVNLEWINASYIALLIVLMIAPHIYSANTFFVKRKDK